MLLLFFFLYEKLVIQKVQTGLPNTKHGFMNPSRAGAHRDHPLIRLRPLVLFFSMKMVLKEKVILLLFKEYSMV